MSRLADKHAEVRTLARAGGLALGEGSLMSGLGLCLFFRPGDAVRGRVAALGGGLGRLVGVALVLLMLVGCHRPQPTLVVVVGGLGISQLGDVRRAVARECPRADVVSAGAWDGYKADLPAMVKRDPHRHVVLVGHSFGCRAIAEAAAKLARVDLAVFIDPAWDDFRLPGSIARVLWYRRSGFGLERQARIIGAPGPQTIHGGHNDIPHSPDLIAAVVGAINSIKEPKGVPERGRGGRDVALR